MCGKLITKCLVTHFATFLLEVISWPVVSSTWNKRFFMSLQITLILKYVSVPPFKCVTGKSVIQRGKTKHSKVALLYAAKRSLYRKMV